MSLGEGLRDSAPFSPMPERRCTMVHVAGLAAQAVVPGSAPAGTSPTGPVLPTPGGNFFLRCNIRKAHFLPNT